MQETTTDTYPGSGARHMPRVLERHGDTGGHARWLRADRKASAWPPPSPLNRPSARPAPPLRRSTGPKALHPRGPSCNQPAPHDSLLGHWPWEPQSRSGFANPRIQPTARAHNGDQAPNSQFAAHLPPNPSAIPTLSKASIPPGSEHPLASTTAGARPTGPPPGTPTKQLAAALAMQLHKRPVVSSTHTESHSTERHRAGWHSANHTRTKTVLLYHASGTNMPGNGMAAYV